MGSEGAGRVGAVHGGIAADAGALAKRAQPHVGGPCDTAVWVSDQQAQLVLFDDDRVVVAPLARAHPASTGGVGEGTLTCGPTRAAADVLHDELLLRAAERHEVTRGGRGRAAAPGSAAALVVRGLGGGVHLTLEELVHAIVRGILVDDVRHVSFVRPRIPLQGNRARAR